MFDDLHDPDPPHPGLRQLAAVSERARRLRRRRTIGRGVAAMAALGVLLGAVVAVAAGDGTESIVSGPPPTRVDDGTAIPSTSPTTSVAASVAPTTTTIRPTTTTSSTTRLPAKPIEHFAIGDSVMLGAATELTGWGITVDAVVSRQPLDAIEVMRVLREAELLGSSVVVHVGTNGTMSETVMDLLMAELVDVPRVVVLTIKAERGWTAGNNETIRALATYPNVTVLDWERLAEDCPGDCLADDGIHLTETGRRYYAALIATALGLTAEPTDPRPEEQVPTTE